MDTQTVTSEEEEWTEFEAKLKTDWHDEDGVNQIHLDGEMDFRADLSMDEIYETLHERAKQIGGLVSKSNDGRMVTVSTQHGALKFRLIGSNKDEPLSKIISHDQTTGESRIRSMEDLQDQGEAAEEFKEKLEEAIDEGDIEISIEEKP
jgi:lipoate-protein ligase A